ncbi:MAG TPA: hypothetical protein VGK33_07035, partial [Chloroflexota bacterium]
RIALADLYEAAAVDIQREDSRCLASGHLGFHIAIGLADDLAIDFAEADPNRGPGAFDGKSQVQVAVGAESSVSGWGKAAPEASGGS